MDDLRQQYVTRRRKLVNKPLQGKLIFSFAGMSLLAFLIQFLFLGRRLSELANQLGQGGDGLSIATPSLLLEVGLVSIGVLLPLTCLIGILITHRIAGPLFRFERHLEAAARGEDPGVCKIRKEDDLQDFCGKLNDGLEGAYQRGFKDAVEAQTRLDAAA